MQVTNMVPVLIVSDVDRTLAFYRDVLAFEVTERTPPRGKAFRVRLRVGSTELVLERAPRPSRRPKPCGIVLTFRTRDVLAAYEALTDRATGVSVPLFTPVGTMACSLTDLDGYELSFEQPVKDLAMTKERLLDVVRDSHARFERVIERLSDEEMLVPEVQGKWSAKDILAHMSAWEDHCLGFLDADARGETPGFITSADVDRVNEQFYQESRDKSLDEVRKGFAGSFQRLLDRIEALSDEDLLSPERYPWFKGSPFWLMVAYNTFDHYPRHARRIEEWLTQRGKRN